jgi:signal peptidase II
VHGVQAERRTALTLRVARPIWGSVLLAAWLVWLLDVGTKTWALSYLGARGPIKVLGTFLQFTLTKNSGAAFSVATGGAVFLATFGFIVVFFIAYWARRITSSRWALVLGLVLGGTLGNLTDRTFRGGNGAFRGKVIDWIELPHWPIFNVADSAIVIAALLAVVLALRNIAPVAPKNEDKEGPRSA